MLNKQYTLRNTQNVESLGIADGYGSLDLYAINSMEMIGSCKIIGANVNDIIYVNKKGYGKTIFSSKSTDNTLFITNQCNNKCLMCSQPPTLKEDLDFYYQLNKLLIKLLPNDIESIGITGGEPTLLGGRLLDLIELLYSKNQSIIVNMLSNGRLFSDRIYAQKFEKFSNKNLTIGIPIHSDYSLDHDTIAGVHDAYNQTMRGLYNLALYNIDIELRVVIHKLNYIRLDKLASYIFKNLPFVSHIAFMGLENTGLAIKNRNQVGTSVKQYIEYLERAVTELSDWGMHISIYNIPLCMLKPSLYQYARRSISDWKEFYTEECFNCLLKSECCGLFSTSHNIDKNEIKPIRD